MAALTLTGDGGNLLAANLNLNNFNIGANSLKLLGKIDIITE